MKGIRTYASHRLWLVFLAALGVLCGVDRDAWADDLLVSSHNTNNVLAYDMATGHFNGALFAPGTGGLNGAHGLTFGRDGNLYVCNRYGFSIDKYDGKTGALIGVFVSPGSGGLNIPIGLTFGPDGNLYVSSFGSNQILRYDGATGAFMGTFATTPVMAGPNGLTFGPDGNLYISSFFNSQILRYNGRTGAFMDVFASGGGLSGPTGLVFQPDGSLYVSSYNTHQILRYGPTGAFRSVFVAAGSGGLKNPYGLAFGPDGNLYVCSYGSNQVLRYHGTTGAFISVAAAPSANGLNAPTWLTFRPNLVPAPMYEIKDLGALNALGSQAYGINNNGQVVGNLILARDANGNPSVTHGFLYSNGVMTDMGTMGGGQSQALGINSYGQVVGWSINNYGWLRSFLYSNGTFTDLDPVANSWSYGLGVNNNGQVTGLKPMAEDSGSDAYFYANGAFYDLGTLGGSSSVGYTINDQGWVAGYSYLSTGPYHAFGADDYGMYDLGTLGGNLSIAQGLNNAGQVVGWASVKNDAKTHGFLYSRGAMTDLGTLGGINSNAFGINNLGQVVGEAHKVGTTVLHAYVYNAGTMVDLNTRIPDGSGWELVSARGISDKGLICGYGTIGGKTHAFLLTPIQLDSVTVTPATVAGGLMVSGYISLTRPAPNGDALVTLTYTGDGVTLPAAVSIPEGATGAWFTMATTPVKALQTGSVVATYGGVTKSAVLKVRPVSLQTVGVSPNPIPGGANAVGTITLEAPAGPNPITVTLASSDPATARPADASGNTLTSLTIPVGLASKSFTLRTAPVAAQKQVTLTATVNGLKTSTTFTVRPVGVVSLSFSPNSVKGGGSVTGTVTLEAPAPGNGITVQLTSNDTTTAPAPASITIPAGANTGTFTIQTAVVSGTKNVSIIASATNGSGITQTTLLTVTP